MLASRSAMSANFARFPHLFAAILLIVLAHPAKAAEEAAVEVPVEAAVEPKKTEELNPVVVYTTLVGEIAADREDYATALGYYLHAAKISKDAKIAERTTEIALRAGSASAALEAAGIWADAAPTDPQAQLIAATLYLKFDTAEQAKPYLARIALLSTKEVAESCVTIRSQLTDKNEYLVFTKATELLQEESSTANTLFMSAFTQESLENYPAALKYIDAALQKNPESVQIIAMRVQILRDDHQGDAALAYTEENIKKYPKQAHLRWIYAEQLIDVGKAREAETYYKALLADPEYRPDSLISLAKISIEKEDLSKAEEYLASVLSEFKNPNAAYYYMGRIAQIRGKPHVAITWYSQVNEGTYFLTAHVQASLLMAKNGESDKALQRLVILEKNFPEQQKYLSLAKTQVLLDAKQYDQALIMLDKIIATNEKDTDLLYAHGLVASKLARVDLVENDLREVLKQKPNHVESLNILAFTLASFTERFDEALVHAKKAIALAPEDPFVMDSIGFVYFRMGNYNSAINYFNQAFSLSHDPDIAVHLGEALWNSGQKEQAKQVLQNALEETPSHDSLQELAQRFDNE